MPFGCNHAYSQRITNVITTATTTSELIVRPINFSFQVQNLSWNLTLAAVRPSGEARRVSNVMKLRAVVLTANQSRSTPHPIIRVTVCDTVAREVQIWNLHLSPFLTRTCQRRWKTRVTQYSTARVMPPHLLPNCAKRKQMHEPASPSPHKLVSQWS